jgi:uncharacterized protein YbdZ (MbtH family)
MPDDPLTEAEIAFCSLLSDPRRYSLWARKVRAEWERTDEGRGAVEARRKGPG